MLQLRSSYHSTLICRENCKDTLETLSQTHIADKALVAHQRISWAWAFQRILTSIARNHAVHDRPRFLFSCIFMNPHKILHHHLNQLSWREFRSNVSEITSHGKRKSLHPWIASCLQTDCIQVTPISWDTRFATETSWAFRLQTRKKSDRNPKVHDVGMNLDNFSIIFASVRSSLWKKIHALIWPLVFSPSMASRAKSRDWLWNWDLVLPSHQFQGLEDFFPPILRNGEKQARGEAGPMFQQFGSNFKALLQLLF